MARLLSPKMSMALGQPVVVDNRPGAGGTIAARAVSESEPDGHTLLLGNTSTLVISPLIYKNIGYDPLKGFAPLLPPGAAATRTGRPPLPPPPPPPTQKAAGLCPSKGFPPAPARGRARNLEAPNPKSEGWVRSP